MGRLQFQVRHLLILMSVVSIAMLIAVKWLPLFLVVCFWCVFIAAITGLVFVTSAERPRIAIASWFLMGASLVGLAVFNLSRIPASTSRAGSDAERWVAIVTSLVIGCVGLAGFFRARQAFVRSKPAATAVERQKTPPA